MVGINSWLGNLRKDMKSIRNYQNMGGDLTDTGGPVKPILLNESCIFGNPVTTRQKNCEYFV